jgi:toxin ParE1/3/4
MKSRKVVYAETAKDDLLRILRWLAENASIASAVDIVGDLESFIDRLDVASERGTLRDDISTGLRMVSHKRADIAILVDQETVVITRIFYGGEDYEQALRRP